MTEARFIQIHSIHSYSSALLNRDDTGLAKRLPYGGVMRTRVSSQCLKRHWRKADDDPHSLLKIAGATDAFRSRELVAEKVLKPLDGAVSEPARHVLEHVLHTAVYGDKGTTKQGRQILLFGEPETTWLAGQARDLAPKIEAAITRTVTELGAEPSEEKARKKFREDRLKKCLKAAEAPLDEWEDKFKANIKALRDQTALPGGLASALFGRMVTSDPAANIDAPIHVAHAFTVHEAETESDYLTAVDDLKREDDDAGAGTIQETELTSGLFYGYVVIDVPGLVSNTTGVKREELNGADRTLAAEVAHNLLYLIAEVTPGANLGSTAPYGRAELMLIEAGDRQPRSLAAAFRRPIAPRIDAAIKALDGHLSMMDKLYETGEARRVLHVLNEDLAGAAKRGSLREIAAWTRHAVLKGEAAA